MVDVPRRRVAAVPRPRRGTSWSRHAPQVQSESRDALARGTLLQPPWLRRGNREVASPRRRSPQSRRRAPRRAPRSPAGHFWLLFLPLQLVVATSATLALLASATNTTANNSHIQRHLARRPAFESTPSAALPRFDVNTGPLSRHPRLRGLVPLRAGPLHGLPEQGRDASPGGRRVPGCVDSSTGSADDPRRRHGAATSQPRCRRNLQFNARYTKIKSILETNRVQVMKDATTTLPLEDLQAKIKDLEDSNSVMVPQQIRNAFEGPCWRGNQPSRRRSRDASW